MEVYRIGSGVRWVSAEWPPPGWACPDGLRSAKGVRVQSLSVTDAQRAVLEGWVRRRTTAQALAQRSRIVLECAESHSPLMDVPRRLRITPDMVRTWRRRFLERGLDGLCDDPRPGVPRKITDADVERLIVKTLEVTPRNATHWSTRSMAARRGCRSRRSRGSGGRSPSSSTGRDVRAVERPAVH
ncbi:helix-turn-helix domain-containing protein [Streptomyces sp. NPDC053431]|uniref:helix-turn-helix domain-containing protein n=1 Tax=Streptomyces sp. NPDC053431 TaxID=3365703 RepID=UPI0037D7F3FE